MLLTDFAEKLAEAETEQVILNLLNKYLKDFGFQYYAFTYYSGHTKTGRKLHYDLASPALRPWHEHYLAEGYADADRTLEESVTMTLPLLWNVNDQLKTSKHAREKRMREESIRFGIDIGLSVPIYGPNYDIATLTLHQCRGETCLKDYKIKQYEWLSATLLFYHHIKRILNLNTTGNFAYKLTKREKQCLILTMRGLRVEQIAKELQLSVRTVNFHIQNANKKLGSNNKYLTAYKYFNFI